MYITSLVSDPPSLNGTSNNWANQYHPGQQDYNSVIHKPCSSFIKNEGPEESKKRTWETCTKYDGELEQEGKERKRRLVSLFEANEVAKRVAGGRSGFGGNQMVINGGLVDDGKKDIVSEWMGNL